MAFTVTSILEDENKRHREIWMQRLKAGKPDGEPFRFTSPVHESSSPGWSPGGTVLSFSSRRGKDKESIWFIRVVAPGGEAYHIDGVKGRPVWSPDGEWIAFTHSPEDEEDDEGSKEEEPGREEDRSDEEKPDREEGSKEKGSAKKKEREKQ